MPPTRRNLIAIVSLCLLTLFLIASMRVYQSISKDPARSIFNLKYAPYSVPQGSEDSFFGSFISRSTPTPTPTPTPVVKATARIDPLDARVPVSAKAYVVADVETGKIYYARNGKGILPVASMSKLITAFVATDSITAGTIIPISEDMVGLPPDTSNLLVGEKFPIEEILYPLLLSSSNVAAEAIASGSGHRSDFLELMSSYSWEIGMPGTYFADASGISPSNAASAEDLLALASYLYKSRPDILAITRTPLLFMSTTTDHGPHQVVSTHPFVTDPDFIGGKTGRTPEAGETMMTIIRVNGRPIAIVVLGSQLGARESDTRALLTKIRQTL